MVGAIGLDTFKRELEQVDGFRLLSQSLESGVQVVAIVKERSAGSVCKRRHGALGEQAGGAIVVGLLLDAAAGHASAVLAGVDFSCVEPARIESADLYVGLCSEVKQARFGG